MKRIALALVLSLTVLCGQVFAAPISVSSRAALGGNDFFDWATLGANPTSVSNPFNIVSDSGFITATVSIPTGTFTRVEENTATWGGNFASGDDLIWTGDFQGPGFADDLFYAGPMTIAFSTPVYGAGAQVQGNVHGFEYAATIEAFDALNNSLGTYSVNHTSSDAQDNSAPFLGFLDTVPSISKITFNVAYNLDACGSDCVDFAINQLDVVTPEPATLLLLGSGLAGLGLWRRRKRIQLKDV